MSAPVIEDTNSGSPAPCSGTPGHTPAHPCLCRLRAMGSGCYPGDVAHSIVELTELRLEVRRRPSLGRAQHPVRSNCRWARRSGRRALPQPALTARHQWPASADSSPLWETGNGLKFPATVQSPDPVRLRPSSWFWPSLPRVPVAPETSHQAAKRRQAEASASASATGVRCRILRDGAVQRTRYGPLSHRHHPGHNAAVAQALL